MTMFTGQQLLRLITAVEIAHDGAGTGRERALIFIKKLAEMGIDINVGEAPPTQELPRSTPRLHLSAPVNDSLPLDPGPEAG